MYKNITRHELTLGTIKKHLAPWEDKRPIINGTLSLRVDELLINEFGTENVVLTLDRLNDYKVSIKPLGDATLHLKNYVFNMLEKEFKIVSTMGYRVWVTCK